jgi:hypothetical protein
MVSPKGTENGTETINKDFGCCINGIFSAARLLEEESRQCGTSPNPVWPGKDTNGGRIPFSRLVSGIRRLIIIHG